MEFILGEEILCDRSARGAFLSVRTDEEFYEKEICLGAVSGSFRFHACYRSNCCWMESRIGKEMKEIPEETQYLIMEQGNRYLLIFALVDGTARSALYGAEEGIYMRTETGDEQTRVSRAVIGYLIEGDNPYELVKTGTCEIADRLKSFRPVSEKKFPAFADYLGFCTYNAFGTQISREAVRTVLTEFRKNGAVPGFLILDVGWGQYEGNYLISFHEDKEKFPGGLRETIDMAKQFGVKKVLLWHTYNGFWQGVSREFPDYEVEMREYEIPRRFAKRMAEAEDGVPAGGGEGAERLKADAATAGDEFYPANMIAKKTGFPRDGFERFYHEFYEAIKKKGADGSKVDAMSWVECFAKGKGGRAAMMRRLVSAVETASGRYFDGEHISCSSCSNDFIYNAGSSGVTRTSTDYFPDIPASHGRHVFTNANTSFWMGEVIFPDWDMFQSGNTAGEFHAMARAISGGPIYCTDEIGRERFDILRKLEDGNGRIGRCRTHARISRSSLFADPEKETKAALIFNHNGYNSVIGAFHCSYREGKTTLADASVRIRDIEELKGERFAVYSFRKGFLGVFDRDGRWEDTLWDFEADLYTVAALTDGYAVIGMTEKYNPGGFIERFETGEKGCSVTLREPGAVTLYAEEPPEKVSEPYTYQNGLLTIQAAGDLVTIIR